MDGFLAHGDAYELAEKIIEMADRLKPVNKIMPGTVATLLVTIDGTLFTVALTVATPEGKD
jgi:hypothetical protein